MKIQNNSNYANPMNHTKKGIPFSNRFADLLTANAASEIPDQNHNGQSQSMSNAGRIDNARQRIFSHTFPAKLAGVKDLINDAVSDTSTHILQEIESLCSDETGENIDMKLLDDLLELYIETRSKDKFRG